MGCTWIHSRIQSQQTIKASENVLLLVFPMLLLIFGYQDSKKRRGCSRIRRRTRGGSIPTSTSSLAGGADGLVVSATKLRFEHSQSLQEDLDRAFPFTFLNKGDGLVIQGDDIATGFGHGWLVGD